MKNLISSEIYKCIKSKAFRICTIIGCGMAIFTVVTFLMYEVMMEQMMESGMDFASMGLSEADVAMLMGNYDGEMLLSTSFYSSSLQILVAVFIAIFVAGEFANGTIKMMVSRGYSRTKIYMAKLLSGTIAGNIMATIIVIVTTVVACVLWGWNAADRVESASVSEILIFLLIQFLLNTAITAMFVSIAMIFRNLGGAIAIAVSSYSFASIIFLLCDAVIKAIATAVELDVEKLPCMPSDLWIVQTIANMSKFNLESKDIILAIGVSIGYTILFTLCGALSFKVKDIK